MAGRGQRIGPVVSQAVRGLSRGQPGWGGNADLREWTKRTSHIIKSCPGLCRAPGQKVSALRDRQMDLGLYRRLPGWPG